MQEKRRLWRITVNESVASRFDANVEAAAAAVFGSSSRHDVADAPNEEPIPHRRVDGVDGRQRRGAEVVKESGAWRAPRR